jgi:hypothetical protein
MPNNFIQKIISGGQTGVDRAALDIAIHLNIPHGGWCPYGRTAEDGIIPTNYCLKETSVLTFEENLNPDVIYKKRTELNVRDSGGTLIIVNSTPIGGTRYTVEVAERYKKPYFVFNLSSSAKVSDINAWVVENDIHILNVAGPRASQAHGIYNLAYSVLQKLLAKTQEINRAPIITHK